mgnify:CR=1 FL=1
MKQPEKVTHPLHGPGQIIRHFHDPALPGLVLVEFPGMPNTPTTPRGNHTQPWVRACLPGELKIVGDQESS